MECLAGARSKGPANIRRALNPGELGLSAGRPYALEQARVDRQVHRLPQAVGQTLGLVKLSFSLFQRMQWHGDQKIAIVSSQKGSCLLYQQTGQEWLKP